MKIDIFTLCDNAQEYNGKLVIVGTFNELFAGKFPATHPEMAIVARTIIEEEDPEEHELEISAIKAETGENALLQPFNTQLSTKGNKGKIVFSNLILRINNMVIQEPGKYIIKFRIDKLEKETILNVRNVIVQK